MTDWPPPAIASRRTTETMACPTGAELCGEGGLCSPDSLVIP